MSDLSTMSTDELIALKNKMSGGAAAPTEDLSSIPTEKLLELRAKLSPQPQPQVAATPVPAGLSERDRRMMEASKRPGALVAGAAKGLGDVARGVGVLEQLSADEKAAFDALAAKYPEATVGEIVGQVAPFLIPGTMAARIASLPARALASAATGAAEGGIITKGQGGTNAEAATMAAVGAGLGAGTEMLAPVVNRGVSALGRALGLGGKPLLDKLGRPTPAFQAALDQAGIAFSDISETGLAQVRNLPKGSDPTQAARMARFKSEGINPTAGQVTQDFAQQAREARLENMASGEAGDPLRARLLEQSLTFEGQIDKFVSSLGVPDKAGATIKEALSGRKTLLRAEKNKLYGEIAKAAPEVANAPILTDSIISAMADKATKRRIGRLAPAQANAVDDLFVEFGLDKSPEAVEAFKKSGGEINPLTLGNFEDFRQALNLIERTDQTGAVSVLTGPIKAALDEEAALIDDAVKSSGLSDAGVLDTLKEARARVRELKTEFSPQALAGKLIEKKADRFTPVVEASQVTDQLLRSGTSIEQLSAVMNNLAKAGPKGAEAIKDLQATTVMQAMDAALKAPSRKTSGVQTMGGNQFAKALDAIGDNKLAIIFRGNEDGLRRLTGLRQIALDMQPTAGAVPKGSAPVILDMLATIGGGQAAGEVMRMGRVLAKAGSDDRAVAAALKGNPEIIENARQITRLYPSLATALGLGALIKMDRENAPQR